MDSTAPIPSFTPENVETLHCAFCDERIRYDLGTWVDDSLGDCCSGDDEQNNENGDHVPTGFTTHNTNTQGDPT